MLGALLLCVNSSPLYASLRTDLTDRTPEEVLQRSVGLGKTLDCSKVTGAVVMNDGENLLTGVALDRHTILTAAHFDFAKPGARIKFILSANFQGQVIKKSIDPDFDCLVYEIDRQNIHVCSSFKNVNSQRFALNIEGDLEQVLDLPIVQMLDRMNFGNRPVKELEYLNFEAYKQRFLSNRSFCGVDLLILKTKKPLPQGLHYPKFAPENRNFEEQNCLSIGFGETIYNQPPMLPICTSKNPLETNQRHVISCKVSQSCLEAGNHVFFGRYEGLYINGDQSFIPKNDMLKTTGLPVAGDSGGPLFVQKGESFELCGIMSQTLSPMSDVVENPIFRKVLKTVKQPIFPIWQDVRPYLPWIKSHMEK